MNSNTLKADYLITGSGAAGLIAALQASQYGKVILITKSSLEASSSYWAQGGIAAVINSNDSFESHKQDTLDAGRGLCDSEAVDVLVEEGAERVQELIDLGMSFDQTNGTLDLGLEGGHSNRRVLHANGAATGKVLIDFLTDQVKKHKNITIVDHAFVFELLMENDSCVGASAYLYEDKQLISIQSPVTILATGGYSGLYQRSTNPHTSTGDGLWLGYNVGAELQDLELVQFHPTAFYAEDGSTFLISEAVRGEGARLYNEDGDRFMSQYPQKELSPRDVVSQEIFEQIQQQLFDFVYLDVRHLDADKLRNHFPNLFDKIEASGIDIENGGIPVAPAAHYCIGGIATNLHGQTSISGLYACGEVAATGVHGANRLASNSLLECLVFSKRAVDHAVNNSKKNNPELYYSTFVVDQDAEQDFSLLQAKISVLLSRYVGIRRNEEGLKEVLSRIYNLQDKLHSDKNEYYGMRSQGMLKIAELITHSALQRKESRGVHTRSDYPDTGSEIEHTKFSKENQQSFTVEY